METKTMQLSLDGDTFEAMKEDFDTILARTISNMESKCADEATITLKLNISLEKEHTGAFNTNEEDKEIVRPDFKHVISSVMQVKDKKSGSLSGDYELVWSEEESKYVMKKMKDDQISLFDEDDEIKEKALEEPEEAYDTDTPFGWLRQFIGEELTVTEAMDNYTVRTSDNKIILSSASDKNSDFYCDAEKLAPHVGHKVVCVGYGGEMLVNISIECDDCGETLFSLDLELDTDIEDDFDDLEFDEPEDE